MSDFQRFRSRIVMARGRMPNLTGKGGGDTNTQHVSRITFGSGPYPVSDLQVVYPWVYMAGGVGEAVVGNGATISSAFEFNGHGGRRISFDGGAINHVVGNVMSLIFSDVHPEVVIGPYTAGFIRSMVEVTAGQVWPMAGFNGIHTGAQKGTAITAQLLSSGTVTGGTNEAGQYGPVAVIGKTLGPTAAVLLLGCSLEDGTADTKDSTGDWQPLGYAERGLVYNRDGVTVAAPFAYAKMTMGSETMAALVEPNTGRLRMTMGRYATDVYLGTLQGNDVAAGTDPLVIQPYVQRVAWFFKSLGCRVWIGNIAPRTTGTFTSAAGQTYSAHFGPGSSAEIMNAWLPTQLTSRGGPIDGIFDLYSHVVDPKVPWKIRSDDGVAQTEGTHYLQSLAIKIGKGFRLFAERYFTPVE